MGLQEDLEQAILNRLNNKTEKYHFSFYSQWSSFMFWKPMNWRDFTFIHLQFEINSYHWIEIDFAILGFKFSFTGYRK